MGASSELFIEVMTVEIEAEKFKEMAMHYHLELGKDYNIKVVDVPKFPYKGNDEWEKQKKISNKAYKELKRIEFEIRNKN